MALSENFFGRIGQCHGLVWLLGSSLLHIQ